MPSLVAEAMGASRRLSAASARCRAASALGAAGRLLWFRKDLSNEHDVVVDLITEALVRIGNQLRPVAKSDVAAALSAAPAHIQDECALLVALASSEPLLADKPPGKPSVKISSLPTVIKMLLRCA